MVVSNIKKVRLYGLNLLKPVKNCLVATRIKLFPFCFDKDIFLLIN